MNQNGNLIAGKNYPILDVIRGIAIILVLFYHAAFFACEINAVCSVNDKSEVNLLWIFYNLSYFGTTGVDLFFVLSGFLITGILIDTRNHKKRYKIFYIRRALRIIPLYYLVIFLVAVYFAFISTLNQFDIKIFLQHMFYLQNMSPVFIQDYKFFNVLRHTWSLAVEEQFYLIWPVIFYFSYKKSHLHAIYMCLGLIVICWLSRYIVIDMGNYKLATTLTIMRLDGLVVGALAALIVSHYKDRLNPKLVLYITGYIGAIFFIVFFISAVNYNSRTFLIEHGYTLSSFMYGGIILYLMLKKPRQSYKFSLHSKFLILTGKFSYGIYILHYPLMWVIFEKLYNLEYFYAGNMLIILLFGTLFSYFLAYISYNFYEKKFLSLKEKYAAYK